jgi:hypothetical protein
MKKWLSFVLLFAAVLMTNVLASCGDDDNNETTTVAGTYTGTDSLHFEMDKAAYKAAAKDVKYVVTENSDKSINVTFPEETYDFTATVPMVGKVVQGSYTVRNIPYVDSLKAYSLDYANKGIKAHVTMSRKDSVYELTVGKIEASFAGNTMKVTNKHKFGHMPMVLAATYIGTK